MGCSPPGYEDLDDEGEDFMAAAQRDDALVAELLIRLSRSEPGAPKPLRPPGPKWGRQGKRSRTITMEGVLAAKEEDARRASPTTPLSWSGGSGTSGSVCGDGLSTRRKKRSAREYGDAEQQQQQQTVLKPAAAAAGERIRVPPAKRRKPDPFQNPAPVSEHPEMETTSEEGSDSAVAVGSSTGSGSGRVVAAAVAAMGEPAPSSPAARVEPLRLRLTAEGSSSVVVGRPGKKKTFAELEAMRETLLQEQEELQKELEMQKVVYDALLEENMRLKKVESSLSSPIESRPTSSHVVCEEPKLEQPQHVQPISEPATVKGPPLRAASVAPEEEEESPPKPHSTSSSSSAPGCTFLFDLNCVPDDDL